jgi:hypothetical protein
MPDYFRFMQIPLTNLLLGCIFALISSGLIGWIANIMIGRKQGCLALMGLGFLGTLIGLLIAYLTWWLLDMKTDWDVIVPGWWVILSLAVFSILSAVVILRVWKRLKPKR